MGIKTTCFNCKYYRSGHLDKQVNYHLCEKGYRLIAKEEHILEHRLSGEPGGEIIMKTQWGDYDCGVSSGTPMLLQNDCADWKRMGFRLDLGDPEYD